MPAGELDVDRPRWEDVPVDTFCTYVMLYVRGGDTFSPQPHKLDFMSMHELQIRNGSKSKRHTPVCPNG